MSKQENLEQLENALSNGVGFENTAQGKELNFNEGSVKLKAFNDKQSFVRDLRSIKTILQNEEDLYNEIKENISYHKSKLIDFIETQKGSSINGRIKTSEIKMALESYQENSEERSYESKHMWVKTLLDVMRYKEFDIVSRFSSDVETLVGNNLELNKVINKDLNKYITDNNLNLVEILSIKPRTLKESVEESMNNELNYHYANDEAINLAIKDKLKEATHISFGNELDEYIKQYDFRFRDTSYKDFYEMMVSIAIDDVEESMEGQWNTLLELKNDPRATVLAHQKENEHEDDYRKDVESLTVQIEDDTYRVDIKSVRDCEGKSYSEKWHKNDELHRASNLPAKIYISHHFIPSETYLDDAFNEYWTEGELKRTVDTTYEDVLSKKSLAERQSIGCDVDDYDGDEPETILSYDEEEYIKEKVQNHKEYNGLYYKKNSKLGNNRNSL